MLWIQTPIPAGEAEELSKRAGVGTVVAELLVRAGHRDPLVAAEFLRPDLSKLEDPFLVGNLVAAASRLRAAILAATRRGSRTSTPPNFRSAGGTRVVFPAPGAASMTRLGWRRRLARIPERSESMGSGARRISG